MVKIFVASLLQGREKICFVRLFALKLDGWRDIFTSSLHRSDLLVSQAARTGFHAVLGYFVSRLDVLTFL